MKKYLLISTLLVSMFFTVGAVTIFAQDVSDTNQPDVRDSNPSGIKLANPFGNNEQSLFGLLKTIINDIVLPIGGILAVLAFIYSGFLYVMARGNEDKLKTANRALLYTSIGTAVLLGSWVLANVICQTIGLLGGPGCPV